MEETPSAAHELSPVQKPSKHFSHSFNPLKLFLVFVTLAILGILLGSFLFIQNKTPSAHTSTQSEKKSVNEVITPLTKQCIFSGNLDQNFYLTTYTVKPGDSLLSIAKNQLGDSSRVDELIALNTKTYPQLSFEHPVISAGWKLHIPPSYFSRSSGSLEGFAGEITQQSENWLVVAVDSRNLTERSDQAGWINYLIPQTKLLGKDTYKVGDCVYGVRYLNFTVGDPTDILLALSPQDKNYFTNTPNEPMTTPKTLGKCQYYGYLDKDSYLKRYVIQKGESISAIASRLLGDSKRTTELMNLNTSRYTHLSYKQPFVEIGWQLFLPPSFAASTSGILKGMGGEIAQETADTITLDLHLNHPSYNASNTKWENQQYVFYKTNSTRYFGKDSFHKGDCVYALGDYTEERATVSYNLLGISPQDKYYFK